MNDYSEKIEAIASKLAVPVVRVSFSFFYINVSQVIQNKQRSYHFHITSLALGFFPTILDVGETRV